MPDHPETGLSVPAMLQRRAILHPDTIAITYLKADDVRECLTYGDLDRKARGIAVWLLANGSNGQRAMLIYPAGLDFIAAFFGCLYAGVTPVPCVSRLRPRNTQTLGMIAANCGATLALTDSQTLQLLVDSAATRLGLRWMASDAPNFAFELCLSKIDEAERETFDLSSWRAALNGAEPVRADTHQRFQAVFSRNGLRPEALCPCYGLAEATLMVTSSRPWQRA